MSFADRLYEVFVVLGNPTAEPAWVETKWKSISDILNPLIEKARGPAAVRSSQLRSGSGSPNQRSISFGRVGWNPQGHKKWVHSSSSVGIDFISTEIWAPSWTACQREGCTPDVFVAVRNEQSSPGEQVSFNPILLMAVASDADSAIIAKARICAEAASGVLEALLRARCVRPWGFRLSEKLYTSAIGDLHFTGLLKRPCNQGPPTLANLEGPWEAF